MRFVDQVVQHVLADSRCRLCKMLLEGTTKGVGGWMLGNFRPLGCPRRQGLWPLEFSTLQLERTLRQQLPGFLESQRTGEPGVEFTS